MDFKNPEILASAFNHRELLINQINQRDAFNTWAAAVLIKETLLIHEQQPEINVDNFSTPLYLLNT